ncbi:MAG: sodium-dependent transporter [Muribaculaceae bacterium]|nr:sodium-dependent transporter [Muribaculaceae bacterium]
MAGKAKFGSKIGLIAATVGSAVGLGNVWRFPSVAQENGGAAFLIIYIACVFILGIPVMLSEFALGRGGNSDAVGVYKRLTPAKKWYFNGILGVLASYIILSFYMVVAGWTLEYFWQSISGGLFDTSTTFVNKMHQLIGTSWSPIIWTVIMILLNMIVLLLGVNKGIEKLSNLLMPLLFVLLIIFCVVSLNLPNAIEGLEFFLKPDFANVSGATFINALGQAFFSLSLGMGILITYAAYYPHDTKLTRTAVTVSLLDFLVAFLMGLIIFPAVKSFGLDTDPEALKGTTLVFVTLPEVFSQMPVSQLWSALFFLLLSVAAITSTISLAEVNVSLMQDRFKFSRVKSSLIVILPLFVLSSICSLSQGPLSDITIMGNTIFDFLDLVATNLMLPISAFFCCIYVGWVLPKNFLERELTNHGEFGSVAYPFVLFCVRYIAPILILFILLSPFLD